MNWDTQFEDTLVTLRALHFSDSLHGWAVGLDQIILRTTNGGAFWKRDSSFVATAGFYDVAFVDTLHGWAGGLNGLAYSSDGGRNWTQSMTVTDPVFEVAFVDSLHGWYCGYDPVMITTDGGQSWTAGDSNYSRLSALRFLDAGHGAAIDASMQPHLTTNGGHTWLSYTATDPFCANALCLVSPERAWAVGDAGATVRTTDAGQNWTCHYGPIYSFHNLAFANSFDGFAISDDSTILRTNDGGNSWTAGVYDTPRHFYNLTAVDPQTLWACSYSGATDAVLRSMNGGHNWTACYSMIDTNITALYAPDALSCWFTASRYAANEWYGACLRTTDGGQSWQHVFDSDSARLTTLCVRDAQTIWLGGRTSAGAFTARTTDGGVTWDRWSQTNGLFLLATISQLGFFDFQNGWSLMSINDEIYGSAPARTTDGGITWTMTDDPDFNLMQMVFQDADQGWVIGIGGYLKRTTDGGFTWHSESSGTTNNLLGITFVNPSTGWICTPEGILSYTGGSSAPEPVILQPSVFTLSAYPNPFNPQTTLQFTLPRASRVTLTVYDLLGRKIATLLDAPRPAGTCCVLFDGARLASGLYFARLETDMGAQVQKLMLVK